jgi:predicted porin
MRANRLSVAAIAALAVATSAFAADALVPYGVVNGEVGTYFDTTDDGNVIGVRSYASRFGLKGAHALPGGLTAVYQLEAGFNAVNGNNGIPGSSLQDADSITQGSGNNALASRNTFAGVAGGFGTFVIGNHDTPYKIAARGAGAISSADSVAELKLQTDRRLQGAVAYIAPAEALGGTTLAVAVVPVNDGAADNSGLHLSLGVLIPVGDTGLTVGAGYESAYVPAADDTITSFFGAVNYKQDAFSVGVGFEVVSAGDDIAADAGSTAILVPASINLGDGLFLNAGIKLTQFDEGGEAPLTNTVGGDDPDESIMQVGVSFGKKWAEGFEAYVGGKLSNGKTDTAFGTKKSFSDFGAGIRVSFN